MTRLSPMRCSRNVINQSRGIVSKYAALAPDSNLGAGSDERIIYIHGLPFRRDQEDLTKSGIGVSVWAGGEYQYPLEDRWRLRAGADISRRECRDNEFDRMSLSDHLGPRLLIGRFSEASLPPDGERAPALARQRAGQPRIRHPDRVSAPAHAADGDDAAWFVARAAL